MVESENKDLLKISDLKGEHSFDVVKSRFSNGLEILKCIYEFFLQLAGLEESFAHGLQKLLRSSSYTLHSNTLMQWLGQDPFEETGSLKNAWRLIGECLSLTAKHHLEKAYLLKQTVAEPLSEVKQELDDIKKLNLKDTKITSIKKLKQQLKAENIKREGMNTEYNKLKSQLNISRVDTLANKNPLKIEEQLTGAEAQFVEQEQLCRKLREEYSITERGTCLQLEYMYNTIHDSEWMRISKIRTSLIEFSKVYSNTGPVYLQYCQKLAIRMYEIDADRDIHEFVLAHEDLTYSQSTNLDHLQDSESRHPVYNPPSSKKSSNSASHPLSHSQKDSLPHKEDDFVSFSKKPSPIKSLITNPLAHKPKSDKPNREKTFPTDPVSPPVSSRQLPPRPPPSIKPKQPHSSTPLTDAAPAATATEDSSQNSSDSKAAKDKVEPPTPYPAPPILHKVQKTEYSLNDIVSMQEKLIKMSEANDYYRIIGGNAEDDVEHLDELKRSITKRLHPDQFADNPELQSKATQKLSYLNTIFTDVLGKEETRRIYNIMCQYRKAYSQITSQDTNSLKVAMDKFQKIYKFFKRNEVPIQLIQEIELALKLLNACIKKAG